MGIRWTAVDGRLVARHVLEGPQSPSSRRISSFGQPMRAQDVRPDIWVQKLGKPAEPNGD